VIPSTSCAVVASAVALGRSLEGQPLVIMVLAKLKGVSSGRACAMSRPSSSSTKAASGFELVL